MFQEGLRLRVLADEPLCEARQAVQLQTHALQHDGIQNVLQDRAGEEAGRMVYAAR